jgi:hypothetical protein
MKIIISNFNPIPQDEKDYFRMISVQKIKGSKDSIMIIFDNMHDLSFYLCAFFDQDGIKEILNDTKKYIAEDSPLYPEIKLIEIEDQMVWDINVSEEELDQLVVDLEKSRKNGGILIRG